MEPAGNLNMEEPGNPNTEEPGNPNTEEPGNPNTGEPGNTSTAEPENLLVLTPTWNQNTYRILQGNHPESSSRFENHILFTPSGNLIRSNPSESRMRNATTGNSGNKIWNRKPDRVINRRYKGY